MKKLICAMAILVLFITGALANDKEATDDSGIGMSSAISILLEANGALYFLAGALRDRRFFDQLKLDQIQNLETQKKLLDQFMTKEERIAKLSELEESRHQAMLDWQESESSGNKVASKELHKKVDDLEQKIQKVQKMSITSTEWKRDHLASIEERILQEKKELIKSSRLRLFKGIGSGIFVVDLVGRVVLGVLDKDQNTAKWHLTIPGSLFIPSPLGPSEIK